MLWALCRIDNVQGFHDGQQWHAAIGGDSIAQLVRREVLPGISSAVCSHLARSPARRSLMLLLVFFCFFWLGAGTVAAVTAAAAIALLFLGLLGLLGIL